MIRDTLAAAFIALVAFNAARAPTGAAHHISNAVNTAEAGVTR